MAKELNKESIFDIAVEMLFIALVFLAPVMRNVGIDIIKDKREGGTGRRIFVIKKCNRKDCEDGVRIERFCEDGHEVDNDRPF